MRKSLQAACSIPVVTNSAKVSLVVGSVLNVINQGAAIWDDGGTVSWWHVAMNFAVPYAVATYSAVAGQRVLELGAASQAESKE